MVCCCPTLRCFANTFIGISLGLGGQAVLWKTLAMWDVLENTSSNLQVVQWTMWLACMSTWLAFLVTYAAKCVMHFDVQAVWKRAWDLLFRGPWNLT